VVDVVRPPPPTPKGDSHKEHGSNKQEYSLLFTIYILIAIMYMIHSGVDLPSEMNNWLHKNPHYINMSLSSLYFLVSIIYITYFHPEGESGDGKMYRIFIVLMILVIVMVAWYKIYKKHTASNITSITDSMTPTPGVFTTPQTLQ